MDVLGLVDIPQWILILIGLLTAGYIYHTRKFGVWSRQGVTQVWPCVPFFGNMLRILRRPVHEVDIEECKKYGKIFGTYEGTLPILMVTEPELIRQVLVKDFPKFPARRKPFVKDGVFSDVLFSIHGERWKTLRAVVSQTFSSGKMRKMSPLVNECSKSLLQNLHEASEKKEPVDCKKVMGAFAMDVIARCAFGTKIDTHKDPNNPFVMNAKKLFEAGISLKLLLLIVFPKLAALLGTQFIAKDVMEFFTEISHRLIKERNEKKNDRVDFLQLLLDASEFKNETAEVQEQENSHESLFDLNENADGTIQMQVSGLKKKALTENEVLAQCFLFFVVGYETTGTNLSHTLYHLALNPEIQDRLVEEIHETLKEHGEINYDTLTKMPYLDAVVSESLRMHSPAIRVERLADEDFALGDTGIVVPKDAMIGIPIYALHHNPEYFPDPETFNPDRFMPENKHSIMPYTYLPFGGGPRNCVALRFALMEAKICIANVLNEYKFSRCTETKVPLEYKPGVTLLQTQGIVLKVEKRSRTEDSSQ